MVILRKPVAGLSETALAKFVARARRTVKLRGMVNVLVTSSGELRSLNRRFREKDKPTDVLSFLPDPGFATGLAGDIAISGEIAKHSAHRLGHSTAQEIKILALHGLLHLAGYDHENDHGVMAAKELNLRHSLGLPAGLIERNGQLTRRIPKRDRIPERAGGKPAGWTPSATRTKAVEPGSSRTASFNFTEIKLRPVPTRAETRIR